VSVQLNEHILDSSSKGELCELIEARAEEFDSINVSTAFSKLLHSRRDGEPHGVVERALQALEECALENIQDFHPKQLSSTLHAMAKGMAKATIPLTTEFLKPWSSRQGRPRVRSTRREWQTRCGRMRR
jgi:hypothetical protein